MQGLRDMCYWGAKQWFTIDGMSNVGSWDGMVQRCTGWRSLESDDVV